MHAVTLAHEVDWAGFRAAARRLVLHGVAPEQVAWSVRAIDDLFAIDALPEAAEGTLRLPRALVALAETVIQAREPARFALLYRLIWRAQGGERHVLEQVTDPEVDRANRLAQAVRRDTHKMRAFLRFRAVTDGEATRHVAWFEPQHFILEANSAFFVRRFAAMTWSILTPYRSAHWDGREVAFAPGARPGDVPDDDRMAEYWRVYFSAIFNPARLKPKAMTAEMPKHYWKNLPEAAAIPELIAGAEARAASMVSAPVLSGPRPTRRAVAPKPAPEHTTLERARAEAAQCRRCPIGAHATQTVFGEGPADARIMLVGEQAGDQEDLEGRPFVGPAGQLLDAALREAGLDRGDLYVTNAVKHFKFTLRGKRRIHASPSTDEIAACRWWLEVERAQVAPRVMVLLGASAGFAVLGRTVAVLRERGRPITLAGGVAVQTVHPAYLLRMPEPGRARDFRLFVDDLRLAATLG